MSTQASPSSLLTHSRNQQKHDLIAKAKTMKMTVWTVEQLCRYLEHIIKSSRKIFSVEACCKLKESESLNGLLEKEKLGRTPSSMVSTKSAFVPLSPALVNPLVKSSYSTASVYKPWPAMSEFCLFEHHFVIVEDVGLAFRPIFKEYKPSRAQRAPIVPTLYMNSLAGNCPFIKPHPSTAAHTTCIANESVCKSNHTMKAKPKIKKPGYCECCMAKFSDMDEV
jgi:Dfp1/Him1, central region